MAGPSCAEPETETDDGCGGRSVLTGRAGERALALSHRSTGKSFGSMARNIITFQRELHAELCHPDLGAHKNVFWLCRHAYSKTVPAIATFSDSARPKTGIVTRADAAASNSSDTPRVS